VRQAFEQSGGEFGFAENGRPFREAKVGNDDQVFLIVEPRQGVEQQGAADLAERQIADLVEKYKVGMGHAVARASLDSLEHFQLEFINQFDSGQNPEPQVVFDSRLHTHGAGEMDPAGTGTADDHDLLGLLEEFAAVQRLDPACGDGAMGDV